jgi:integrase
MPRKKAVDGSIRERVLADGSIKYDARWGREYLGSHDTREAAQGEIDAAKHVSTVRPDRTLAGLAPGYLDQLARLETLRRGNSYYTDNRVRPLWKRHVLSAPFACKDVNRITRDEIAAHVTSMIGQPAWRWNTRLKKSFRIEGHRVGNAQAKEALGQLRRFFRQCTGMKFNPALDIKLPNSERIAVKSADADVKPHLHRDEVERLFALPRKVLDLKRRAVYALGIYAGLRGGEIAGLDWPHFVRLDGRNPEVHIRQSYDGPTKNQVSQREVPLLPPVVEAVKAYRDSLPARPIAGPVFTSKRGRKRHRREWVPGWRSKRSHSGRSKAGRKGIAELAGIRQHLEYRHLRHTFSTAMIKGWWSQPWPVELVAQWMGHEGPGRTLRSYASRDVDRLHDELQRRSGERTVGES